MRAKQKELLGQIETAIMDKVLHGQKKLTAERAKFFGEVVKQFDLFKKSPYFRAFSKLA